MADSDDVLDGWPKRGGPGYFGVMVVSLLISLLVVAGAQLAVARTPALQRALGLADRDADRGRVVVPGVTKIPLEAATDLLASRGLQLLSTGGAADAEVPAGWIVTQSPAAGQKLRRGSTVRVNLSSGPPLVPVPASIVGTSLADADRLLVQAGLHVGSVVATGGTLRVTGTRPAPGEDATAGSAVTVMVEVLPASPAAPVEEPPRRGRR